MSRVLPALPPLNKLEWLFYIAQLAPARASKMGVSWKDPTILARFYDMVLSNVVPVILNNEGMRLSPEDVQLLHDALSRSAERSYTGMMHPSWGSVLEPFVAGSAPLHFDDPRIANPAYLTDVLHPRQWQLQPSSPIPPLRVPPVYVPQGSRRANYRGVAAVGVALAVCAGLWVWSRRAARPI